MAAKHRIPSWAIVTIAVLLLAACNPIPATPAMPTSVPTPLLTPERGPMQASLYDFVGLFAKADDGALEPEIYADTIIELVECIKEGDDSEIEQYTPGEIAAGRWYAIVVYMIISRFENSFENTDTGADSSTEPEFYAMLKAANTACMDEE